MPDSNFEVTVIAPQMARVELNGNIGIYTFSRASISATDAKRLRDALDDALEEIRSKWTNRD